MRGVRHTAILLYGGVWVTDHVPCNAIFGYLQGCVPNRVQLCIRRRHQHFHLQRSELRHHLLPFWYSNCFHLLIEFSILEPCGKNFALHLPVSVEAPALTSVNWLSPLSMHPWPAVMLIRIVGCITGVPVTGPGSNNTYPGTQPPPNRSPPSPNGISQYGSGSGTGARVRLTAQFGYILVLCIAAFLVSQGEKQLEL
jgi:hypothetical protein